MVSITCPHCGQVFEQDESKFHDIVHQMYEQELRQAQEQNARVAQAERESAVREAQGELREELAKEASQKDARIAQLEAQLGSADETAKARQDAAVQRLEAQVEQLTQQLAASKDAAARERELAVQRLEAQVEQLTQQLAASKDAAARERELAEQKLEAQVKLLKQQAESDRAQAASAQELAVAKATSQVERERDALSNELANAKLEATAAQQRLRDQAAEREQALRQDITDRDNQISYLKEMRTRLSTKMLGETLEQHCETAFNQLRATAFRTAQFGKDNDAVASDDGGRATKGDYIFRDFTDDGEEYVSIMFEMKNDSDDTATRRRHKNEDFFKKLDEDRRKKGCEYAVLVSLLEPESELYNQGIVDVSYAYPKMYVIRPQLFVPMITILRDAARSSLEARHELAQVRQQNIDVTNFENAMENFKQGFARNYESAQKHYEGALTEIDKAIERLQKVKRELQTSENQLRLANKKADELTIRRLTRNNPTMKAAFEEAHAASAPKVGEVPQGTTPEEPDSVE